MTITPYMNLDLPTVSQTLGPEWAAEVNQAFQVVDSHDHTSDHGAPITPAAMNINASLDMQNNQLLNAALVQIMTRVAADSSVIGSVQRVGSDLYWVNPAGVAVQITSGNAIVAVGSGLLTLGAIAAYPYTVLTSDAQKVLLVDTSAARTLTLPSATNAMYVAVKDAAGSAQANRITVTPDGTDSIDGANESYYIDANFATVGFISDGVSGWYVI